MKESNVDFYHILHHETRKEISMLFNSSKNLWYLLYWGYRKKACGLTGSTSLSTCHTSPSRGGGGEDRVITLECCYPCRPWDFFLWPQCNYFVICGICFCNKRGTVSYKRIYNDKDQRMQLLICVLLSVNPNYIVLKVVMFLMSFYTV